ncbi:MAG: O-antigen ligase family protein [Lentisphaeria bacterium]|nr:O-antigen ligase family protein [Lentisphaeria bacterium]
MKITLKKSNQTVLHGLFAFWLLSEYLFEYSIVSRLALLLFVGGVILVVPKLQWPYLLTWYGLFALWSCLNIALGYAVSNSIAMPMTRTLFLNLLFLYTFIRYVKYTKDVREILKIYQWIALLFSSVCLIGGIGSVFMGYRLSAWGINSNSIAMMAAYALVLWTSELLNTASKSRWTKELPFLLILLVTILFTGSRKGLILVFLGLYILLCFRKPRKFLLYTLGIVLFFAVALFLLLKVDFLYTILGHRVEAVLHFLQGVEVDEASLNTRAGFLSLAWVSSQDSPIFGHGLDCFRTLRYSYGTYSHCNYVEILYSLGWVGVLLYYAPHIWTLFRIPVRRKKTPYYIPPATALLISDMVCDFMNVTYFTRTALIIPMLAMLLTVKGQVYENNESD